MKYHLKHTVKIPADKYFTVTNSKDFYDWSVEKIKLESKNILEQSDSPTSLHRKSKMISRKVSDKTAAVIRQDHVEIIESFDADLKNGTFTWKLEPDILGKRVKVVATGKISPEGTDSCMRDMEVDVKVSIPIIGGVIEKAIDKRSAELFGKLNSVMEEFYCNHFKKTA